MKILIIGGTGNISSSITNQILHAGHDLTIFTLPESDSTSKNSPIPEDAKSLLGDRRDYEKFDQMMKKAGSFDCVIDMFCFSPSDAESTIRSFRGKTSQVIFTSTVDVYTKKEIGYPLNEHSERKPSPSFGYAFEKEKCERLFEKAHFRGDFQLTVIRPAHTYSRFFIHTLGWGTYFLDRIRKGKPMIVHGDGSSIWVATHSDDVARAYLGAIGNKKAFGKAYNLAGDEWMTWNAYHQILAKAIAAPEPELIHIPTDILVKIAPENAHWCEMNFSHNNIFNTTAAKEDLGFQYTIAWEQGSRLGYEWLNQRGLIENCNNYQFYDDIIDNWRDLKVGITRLMKPQDL